MPPLFTALIDTYNQGRFIEEAIESVLAQDFPQREIEIIVVDDGSTDDTAERVKRFGDRIRYIWKPNGGQASALNLGFQEARGEIIATLDADDLWLPAKLRRVAEEFERHPDAGLVCHPYLYWLCAENRCEPERAFLAMEGSVWQSQERVLGYGKFGTCGMALRSVVAAKMLPIPEPLVIYADTYLVNLAPFVTPIVAINEHLTKYRHHGSNHTAFSAADARRQQRRWEYYQRGLEAVRSRLLQMGVSLDGADYQAFFQRHDLVIREFQFQFEPPGRVEYYRHMRAFNQLYGPMWTGRYAAFRAVMAAAGFVLGYEYFEGLRSLYKNDRRFLHLRETWMPASNPNVSHAGRSELRETTSP